MPTKKKPSRKSIEFMAMEAANKVRSVNNRWLNLSHREYDAQKTKAYKSFLTIANTLYKQGKKSEAYRYYKKAKPYATEAKKEDIQARLEELESSRRNLGDYIKKYSPTFAILFLVATLILITFNLTGSAISETQNFTRWMGVACFLCGLIFSFIHIRSKK